MALYFSNLQPQQPQTHIFMIGVGGYPYLKGGKTAANQQYDTAKALGQLSSPPVSTEALFNAAMRLHESNCWAAPLGSIEVLLSPHPGHEGIFAGRQIEQATRNSVRDAYYRWRQRCDSHEGNVAIFYFCGHGLEKGEHYLLTEDFGQIPETPFEGAFAFDATRRAFATCKAKTQIFIVDSCRQVTREMLSADLMVPPLQTPSLLDSDCQYSLIQKAAAHNEQAYGRIGEASFYTKALIGALEGNAADYDSGISWSVSTGTLASKMNTFLQAEAASEDYPQRCISSTSDVTYIIHFPNPPQVPFNISCDPEDAHEHAELSCREVHSPQGLSRLPQAGAWQISVNAGMYVVEASFAQKNYRNDQKFKSVAPPWAKQQLKCV